jgi:hypothetical protein
VNGKATGQAGLLFGFNDAQEFLHQTWNPQNGPHPAHQAH